MDDQSCAGIIAGLRPGRRPQGIAAVLLPFDDGGAPDHAGLARQLRRIVAAGLQPAVNMDTGYVQRLSAAQRAEVLLVTRETLSRGPAHGPSLFVAGAFVGDDPGSGAGSEAGSLEARYRQQMDAIYAAGGTPILFPCPELRALSEPAVVALFARLAAGTRPVLLFELGEMFVPYGRIYGLDTFAALLDLPAVIGLKHSSLNRQAEWARLALRDERRPDFRIYTGNDLAIDMVMYGSDYLLGLAAFHPEAFAARDRHWASGDPRFYSLNDLLQYLGAFAFRPPVPAYRHDAAMFLKLRGIIECDVPPAGAPARPASDRAVLADILERIETELGGS
jgi:dihydrodipicolinate synthase/N-acetylneuraminate lyase